MSCPYSGCFFDASPSSESRVLQFIPLVDVKIHTHILGVTARTTLQQTFVNTGTTDIPELTYVLPLHDDVCVVSFTASIGARKIDGVVLERVTAQQQYDAQGLAGVELSSLPSLDGVFAMRLGTLECGALVAVTTVLVSELGHSGPADEMTLRIPTSVAPWYAGPCSSTTRDSTWTFAPAAGMQLPRPEHQGGFAATVDVEIPGSAIMSLKSPSHEGSLSVVGGRTSTTRPDERPSPSRASAKLTLRWPSLSADLVLRVTATGVSKPNALLQYYPDSDGPGSIAALVTLLPEFPQEPRRTLPDIVFVVDRSASMADRTPALRAVLVALVGNLPPGIRFNVCFSDSREPLWHQSQPYSHESSRQIMNVIDSLEVYPGHTLLMPGLAAAFDLRCPRRDLEVFLLTNGGVAQLLQQTIVTDVDKCITDSDGATRMFVLSVGASYSTVFTTELARAGRGFSCVLSDSQDVVKTIEAIIKLVLLPHIECRLEISYADEFEPVATCFEVELPESEMGSAATTASVDTAPLPPPETMQTPLRIPPLFPGLRSTAYLILPDVPSGLRLVGSCGGQPFEFEIRREIVEEEAGTIHALAARHEMRELEWGRGWLSAATTNNHTGLPDLWQVYPDFVRMEAARLGRRYHVPGKWTSFVPVETGPAGSGPIPALAPANEDEVRSLSDFNSEIATWEAEGSAEPQPQPQPRPPASFDAASPAPTSRSGARVGQPAAHAGQFAASTSSSQLSASLARSFGGPSSFQGFGSSQPPANVNHLAAASGPSFTAPSSSPASGMFQRPASFGAPSTGGSGHQPPSVSAPPPLPSPAPTPTPTPSERFGSDSDLGQGQSPAESSASASGSASTSPMSESTRAISDDLLRRMSALSPVSNRSADSDEYDDDDDSHATHRSVSPAPSDRTATPYGTWMASPGSSPSAPHSPHSHAGSLFGSPPVSPSAHSHAGSLFGSPPCSACAPSPSPAGSHPAANPLPTISGVLASQQQTPRQHPPQQQRQQQHQPAVANLVRVHSVRALLAQQCSDGRWTWTPVLKAQLGTDAHALSWGGHDNDAGATVYALAFLVHKCGEHRGVWTTAVEMAERWGEQHGIPVGQRVEQVWRQMEYRWQSL